MTTRCLDCPTLIETGSRCRTHTPKRGQARGATGYRRQQLTRAIIARDGSRCQSCGEFTTRPEVDHILGLASGGTNDASNLQTLCHACHQAKTTREARGYHRRPSPRLLR